MQDNRFNLTANYPPHDAARRLQTLAQQSSSGFTQTRVTIKSFKNGTHYFKITRSIYHLPGRRTYRSRGNYVTVESNYLKVEAHGYLVGWADSDSTLVIGEAHIDPKTFIINALFLFAAAAMILMLTVAFLAEHLFMAPVVLLVLLAFAQITVFQPEDLAKRQQRTLQRQISRALTIRTAPDQASRPEPQPVYSANPAARSHQ
jgi:ABC-type multidrug transport system fused ATPase/permease subunit